MSRKIDEIQGVYIVKPIEKKHLGVVPKNSGGTIFDKAVYSFTPHRHSQTGLIITGLTKEEAAEFEEAMQLDKGSLSPYNYQDAEIKKKQGKFCWANYHIKIPKEGLILDCTTANDKARLDYKLLMAFDKTAKSQAEVSLNPFAELVIFSRENEAKIEKISQDFKKNAYKKYSSMSLTEMMEFLSVYKEGKFKVSRDSKPDIIDSEVGKVVEREPKEFLETVENPLYKDMAFLSSCLAAKAVFKQGPKYILQGGDILGNNYLEAVTNLKSDDYNGVKISLLAKLEALKS